MLFLKFLRCHPLWIEVECSLFCLREIYFQNKMYSFVWCVIYVHVISNVSPMSCLINWGGIFTILSTRNIFSEQNVQLRLVCRICPGNSWQSKPMIVYKAEIKKKKTKGRSKEAVDSGYWVFIEIISCNPNRSKTVSVTSKKKKKNRNGLWASLCRYRRHAYPFISIAKLSVVNDIAISRISFLSKEPQRWA